MTKPISKQSVQDSPLNASLSDSFSPSSLSHDPVAPLKLSLSQLTTLRWSLSDEVFQLKETGYDAIGLWRPKVFEFGEERAADLLQEYDLKASSLSFVGAFTGGRGFSYLESVADGLQAIEQARILGVENVIVVGGAQNGHTNRHSRRMVIDAMRKLGDVAGKSGIKLSILPMHQFFRDKWTFLNTLDTALDIVAEISHPSVRIAFDAYHLSAELDLVERISEIADLVGIVQISGGDRSPTSDRDRLLPGKGEIPLKEIIQAFQTVGYTGYFDIQVWSDRTWQSNYSHLIEQIHATVKAMGHQTVVGKLQ